MSKSEILDEYDGDVYLYYGDISRDGYDKISSAYEKKVEKRDSVCIILITYGGDPDAAYRIARASQHHYSKVEILIPDICKSAGTLLCIGANKLIFGDRGEMGPLDIQLSKPDEMFENMSGLDIIQALSALENQLLSAFRTYLLDIRAGSRIRTKMAAEIATRLASGFISPIAEKIDPVTLGEHQRAMSIAYDYGERLNRMAESLKSDALVALVSGYPSHGFVIDRKEAGDLFNNVVSPNGGTENIYKWAREAVCAMPYPPAPLVLDVEDILNSQAENKSGGPDESNNAEVADGDDVESERKNADQSADPES